jgi:uncharacterized protein YkwD
LLRGCTSGTAARAHESAIVPGGRVTERPRGWSAAAVTLLLCTACALPPVVPAERNDGTAGTSGTAQRPPATRDVEPTGRHAAVITELHQRINATRARHGARALIMDDALNRAAEGHAVELARRGELTHESTEPGRHSMTDRIDAAGATWRRAAENLVRIGAQQDAVAALAVEVWLSSAGHRQNLLEPAYTHTGIGIARDSGGQWFMVQLFTVPRSGS